MSNLVDLQRRIDELERTVGELARQDVPQWTFGRLQNLTDWFNEVKGSGDSGVIDLSADFVVPAKVRAVLMRADIIAASIIAAKFGNGSGLTDSLMYTGWGSTHDEWISQNFICPCDANGDIWVTFDNTINISLYVLAYYI